VEHGVHRHGGSHQGSAAAQPGALLRAQHQHRHGCNRQGRQQLLGGQAAAQGAEQATTDGASQGPEQQLRGDHGASGSDRHQQQQVIHTANRVQKAGGDAAVGDAMGLGGLGKQQRQSCGAAGQGQGPG